MLMKIKIKIKIEVMMPKETIKEVLILLIRSSIFWLVKIDLIVASEKSKTALKLSKISMAKTIKKKKEIKIQAKSFGG
jgi:hypothetical protein